MNPTYRTGSLFCGLALITVLGLSTGFVRAQTLDPPPPPPPPPEPAAAVLAASLDPKLPTLFVIGDSTAASNDGVAVGWAVPLPTFFDLAKINLANRARSGRSSRTFLTEGWWDKVLADLKPGDFILIQFGHNDGGAVNEEPPGSKNPPRARGSLPGLGEETREIDNIITKKHEVVRTFGWYLRKFINEARTKGATPIVLSTTVRNIWKDGKVERGPGEYGRWSAETAKTEGVAFIDVTAIIAGQYEKMGGDTVKKFFPRDHTHTNADGAELNAASVVAGLKALANHPLDRFMAAKGLEVATAASGLAHAPDFLAWLHLPEPANPQLPTLFLIGDSTVRNGRGDGANNQLGWGEPLVAYFDTTRINVVNRAVGGTSSRSYYTSEHWSRVLAMVKPGDFVMMQFGTNDGGPLNDTSRARGTIKGVGGESEEIDNLLTHRHEVVHTYGWYLRKFIADTRAKGATPIMCSLVPRKTWKDGRIVRSKDNYAGWAEAVARTEGAAFVDLNEIIARRYDELGQEKVEPLFGDPHTHTSAAGAELNAQCVIAGLQGLKDNPLAIFFSTKAADIEACSP
jgi:lysophospholipase L1-like esterase